MKLTINKHSSHEDSISQETLSPSSVIQQTQQETQLALQEPLAFLEQRNEIEHIIPQGPIPESFILQDHFQCIPGVLQIVKIMSTTSMPIDILEQVSIQYKTPLTQGIDAKITFDEESIALESLNAKGERQHHCIIHHTEPLEKQDFIYQNTPSIPEQHIHIKNEKEIIPHKGSFLFLESFSLETNETPYIESISTIKTPVANIFSLKNAPLHPAMLIEIGGQGIAAGIIHKEQLKEHVLVIEEINSITLHPENIETVQNESSIISRGYNITTDKRTKSGTVEVYVENNEKLLPVLRFNFRVRLFPQKIYERLLRPTQK